jgi:hypothetical protein
MVTDQRQQKAVEIADKFRIVNDGHKWLVPSQTGASKYTVRIVGEKADCTCPDFELRRQQCKHVMAVQIVIQREQNPDGTVTVTETVTVSQRKTYKQQWPEYNMAQTNEGDYFQKLLHGLCSEIETQRARLYRQPAALQFDPELSRQRRAASDPDAPYRTVGDATCQR